MVMDRSEKAHKDFGEASSDGEEDFESADEGEGEKKAVGKTKQEKYYKSKDKETGYEKPKECIRENNQASSKNYDGALSVISDQSGSEVTNVRQCHWKKVLISIPPLIRLFNKMSSKKTVM